MHVTGESCPLIFQEKFNQFTVSLIHELTFTFHYVTYFNLISIHTQSTHKHHRVSKSPWVVSTAKLPPQVAYH